MKMNYLFAMTFLIAGVMSCDKDDKTPENPNKVNYAMTVTGGTHPSQTTYLFGTNGFPTGSVGTSNAAELPSSGIMQRYGSNVYLTTFGAPATLRKYEFDAAGKPVMLNSFSVPGLKTFGAVLFISSTEAYAAANGFGGIPKLVKFNPATMAITGTIDLSSLMKAGATEIYYQGMVERDGNLFMGVNYQNASFRNLADSVFIAVINRS